ncbi:MAG: GNAT family N-acetyltransferase [Actinomycetales bacterium]|nr:GNAT family N-acetyltransferase [Actinomycetales bacterium]
MDVTIERVDWANEELQSLVAAQQTELLERYGDEDIDDGVSTRPLEAAVLIRHEGVAVACGALRDPVEAFGEGVGELKRMYVVPEHRRKGLSRIVLRELEKIALERGLRRLVLETGVLQPEAIGLYVTEGYLLIDNYHPYEDEDSSRCFAKSLV